MRVPRLPDASLVADGLMNRLVFEPITMLVDASGRLTRALVDPATRNKLTGYRLIGKFAWGHAMRTVSATFAIPAAPPASVDTSLGSAEQPAPGSLAASDLLPLLESMSPGELAVVEADERAGRNRKTVLGRIVQLQSA